MVAESEERSCGWRVADMMSARAATCTMLPSPLPVQVLLLFVLAVHVHVVHLSVQAALLKPTPQQLKYADQELGAL